MFGLFVVPWDFFHIGLLVVVIMIMITGMVICVSVIGVCCFHWLDGMENNSSPDNNNRAEADENDNTENACQFSTRNQSVHVVVLPEKLKGGVTLDPSQLREHFQRLEIEFSHRRLASEERQNHSNEPVQPHLAQNGALGDGPPPSYDMLYPTPSLLPTRNPETE